MATIRKRGNSFQVQIRRKGHKPISKSFREKKNALAWGKQTESEIERGIFQDTTEAQRTTFGELLDRYATEVLPHKRGKASDLARIKTLKAASLGEYNLIGLTPKVLSQYRDQRLKKVANQTAKHELSLIGRVINHAMLDWGYNLPYGNPVQQVRMPKLPRGRTRRLEPGEQELLLENASERLRPVILFALETGMRRGEIANMEWRDVDLKTRTLHIPETKTGIPRTIPLSTRAIQVLMSLKVAPWSKSNGLATLCHVDRLWRLPLGPKVFNMKPDSITKVFDRACQQAGIIDLRFHDLRHEATSRLFEKGLSHTEVASITGHKDLKMLLRYTHLRAVDLVSKLV